MKLRRSEFVIKSAVCVFGIWRVVSHARIKQVKSTVLFDCAARKADVHIVCFGRKQHDIKVLPVRQVAADNALCSG